VPLRESETLEEAVEVAFELAGPGGVVLLAPACASFDMFRDYAERGRVFKDAVARVARRRS
jgi:UDP-N-acetylmuramoylalanine--D-glutamate ligase